MRPEADQPDPVAAHREVDDQGHCQHIAHADTDAETEPEHLEVHAFGVQAAARPGVEQITRHGQQRKRQQARNEELEFIGAITHPMGWAVASGIGSCLASGAGWGAGADSFTGHSSVESAQYRHDAGVSDTGRNEERRRGAGVRVLRCARGNGRCRQPINDRRARNGARPRGRRSSAGCCPGSGDRPHHRPQHRPR